jgi:hypothetical protein
VTVRIEKHIRSAATKHSLRYWVDKHCPLDGYFRRIDRLYETFTNPEDPPEDTEPDHEGIALVLARMLDKGKLLFAYIDGNEQRVSEDEWLLACEAAAWIILERHDQAIERGKWPPK